MKRTLATAIHFSNLEVGQVYRVRIPALGEVLARLLDKDKLEFEVTEGKLQSQANKAKRWQRGDTFEAITGCADFYEVP